MLFALSGGAVRDLRGEMTQAELAKKAGVARATVIRIERGQSSSITIDTANRIAEALGVNVTDFVLFKTREQIDRERKQKRRGKG